MAHVDSGVRPLRILIALALLPAFVCAQSQGPDIIVGDLNGMGNYGTNGTISAFSIGTDSCNIGNATVNWIAGTNDHPVIAQNIYRIKNGRFEQIGLSWLKHGFTALTLSLCGSCQNPGTGSLLGIGCSDPYGSGLNGSQSGLGPRYEVNPSTGWFTYPPANPAYTGEMPRRIQVNNNDLAAAQNPGAFYLAEGQYVAKDDAAAGNNDNNASYRRLTVSPNGTGGYNLGFNGATVRQKAAIEGWRDIDPTVTIQYVDITDDGRFIVARKINTSTTPGYSRYTYAVHNLNSYRSAESFTVNFPNGTLFQNPYFKDVEHHSGEPYNGTDWNYLAAANGVSWQCTETYAQNPNAHALHWGTSFTFELEANAAPTGIAIGLFAPQPCPQLPALPSSGNYALQQGVPFDFVPVASLSNVVNGPTGDDNSVDVSLPFTFTFYGQPLNGIRVSTNGYVTNTSQPGNVYVNTAIPDATQPNGIIAGLWRDLDPGAGGQIRCGVSGSAPARRFVIDYAAVRTYGATSTNSFQIILDEGSNAITTTIVSAAGNGSTGTRGVESPSGSSGVQRSFNQANSAPANSSDRYLPAAGQITYASILQQVGNGAPGTTFGLRFISTTNAPYLLAVDTSTVALNAFTTVLAITPAFIPVRDGTGLFFLNPADATDDCGISDTTFVVPPSGVSFLNSFFAQAMSLDGTVTGGIRLSNVVDFNGLP